MKLSTKGRYGVRAMFDLAQHYGQGPIPLNSIAQRQNISEPYLEHLISSLRKGGLVRSIRGAQGGYMLAKKPSDITVGDIIRILEGPLAPTECVAEGEHAVQCENANNCITRGVWEKVRNGLKEVMDSITLQDMCDKAAKLKEKDGDVDVYLSD
ncbi:HTH-type transcriptional regulator CymR [Koleobacter methoxysyntrophicus]|uniref:HTH-type transcriptional regulator CymR n=1 Tax=Koleobacter methoxysyntrophicus TaxID=2751313 RepID=A0A8A0RR54_9FIRM|nr:Rrf2 family transcriptional regulator [Koleobacter methoxysyntrophicus]MDI3540675.1 Rrf2 family transcriptional regulator, cysteine metabolism repressor [Thermosediminibacterales bacterium]MDK2901479.1 Rrf2 family transcriptional regulator, cysteine metabolism repressor [Thermosediminibacterales bacterium]NPV42493.1 Rrf2 family transcriptional regulator [Bacillota bacterium]QSQ10008.1 HTH-type transcriptional regulator CymR [Koleobacter methoxysyntrophicus]